MGESFMSKYMTKYYLWSNERKCFLDKRLKNVYNVRKADKFTHNQILKALSKSNNDLDRVTWIDA